jgi:hypothetical protein
MDLGFLQVSFCNISFPQLLVIRLLKVWLKITHGLHNCLFFPPPSTMALGDRVQEGSRVFPPLDQGSKCTKA